MSEPIALERGGLRWHLRDDMAWLLGPDGLRLEEWQAAGQVRVLKDAPHRMLYRVTLPEVDFHLKFYPMNNVRAVLRQLVRPSKARMEYDTAREVARRGVPTIEPLALGEALQRPGASYLLTRTIPGTRSLAAFLENELPLLARSRATMLRQRLAKALGSLIARMHEGGILHHDLHPGNVLLSLDEDDEPTLYLVDLLATHLGAPLDWPASRDNLVILNRWFFLRSARTDRLRFWRAYQECRHKALPPVSRGLRERNLEASTLVSNLRFWRGLDRRCLGNNRYFRRLVGAALQGHVSKDVPDALVETILGDPDALFATPGVRVLKNTLSATVAEVPVSDATGPSRVLIWKRFGVTAWSDPLAALFRPTPALRSWVLGHALRARGLPTPTPLLVLHRSWLAMPREGYLLMEHVPDARHLRDHADYLQTLPPDERDARLKSLVTRLADLVARLHRYRISHRDLKASNVLVSPKPWVLPRTDKTLPGEPPAGTTEVDHLWFIDLVGLRQHPRLSRRRKIHNLARLNASFCAHPLITTTMKLRFLKAYLGPRGSDPAVWKVYWRGIRDATLVKVAKNERNGRPLS
jgi:tRNA A-37 threonylcarbamoyl transferase component Bud32